MKNKKKLIFCTYSSIYSSIVLKQLIEDNNIDVVAIINSTRVHHPEFSQLRGALKQIQLSGWRYSTYLFLITDLFRWFQPLFTQKTIHAMARQQGIPVWDTRDINQSDGVKFISRFKPDYLLAAHFNQLVKSELLSMKNLQCLNIHPSLLPAYRGVDPVFFARLNSETEVGVSLHKMAESFDTGEVLSQKILSPQASESVFSINRQLFSNGAQIALDWLKDEQIKTLKSQTKADGNYDSWPQVAQLKRFKKTGKHLIRISELFK